MAMFMAMKGTSVLQWISWCMLLIGFIGTTNALVEYERSGSCDLTEECVYKYSATQYNNGEEDREKLSFSADVYWHCESSGTFGEQSANEYCFTLSNAAVKASSDISNSTMNYTIKSQKESADYLADEINGEFCYVQTSDGKIVSTHYEMTDNYEGINIKRSIASAFQANFNNSKEDVEETDTGSIHISHYNFDRTSGGVTIFSRDVRTNDLIQLAGEAERDSIVYIKHEESVFLNNILQKSRGILKIKLDFSDHENEFDVPNNDDATAHVNKRLDFGKELESNGSYLIQKAYCKQKARRDITFPDLQESSIEKSTLLATIDLSKFNQYKIRKMREAIPSVPGLLEQLRNNPNNSELIDSFQYLLTLEAQHGTPLQYTPAVSQLIEYYKKIQWSKTSKDIEVKKLIYAFLSADGSTQSQKVLGSLLTRSLSEDERDVLLYQLAQLSKAESELIDSVINAMPSNEDNLLLILGALARNNNAAIQTKVVQELIKRLNAAKSTSNSTEAVVSINYALGNTGSQLAINALLSSLSHDDVDTKISVIRGIGIHLDQPSVQQALITLMKSSTEDSVLEEVLTVLKDAFNNRVLQNPSKELMTAVVDMTIRLENANLYELVIQYLTLVGTNETQRMINIIIQQQNYGQATNEHVTDMVGGSRIKRNSEWNSTSSSYYDLVASYSQRSDDVATYPVHKAYIWGNQYGVSKLNLRVGAGAFVGVYCGDFNKRMKMFAKAKAQVHVLGKNIDVAHLEYSDYLSNNYLYHKVYVKLGSSVLKNVNEQYNLTCRTTQKNLWDINYTLFNLRFGFFLYVATIDFEIRATVSTRGDINSCNCPGSLVACANVVPSVTLHASGGASASLLFLVRGGITVSAEFTYFLEPKMCIEVTGAACDRIDTCLHLYHGYPSSVSIEPWYQYRTIRRWWIRWSDRKVWNPQTWTLTSGKYLLWSSCSSGDNACPI